MTLNGLGNETVVNTSYIPLDISYIPIALVRHRKEKLKREIQVYIYSNFLSI